MQGVEVCLLLVAAGTVWRVSYARRRKQTSAMRRVNIRQRAAGS
jgi:hypothetical protein